MGARLQIWRQRLLPIRRVLVLVLLGLLLLLLLLVRWQAAQRAHQSRVLRWRQVSRPPAQVQRRLVGRHALRHSMLLHVWLLLQWRRRLVLVLLRLPRTGLLVVLQVVLLRTRLLRQVPLLRQMLLLLLVQPSGRRLVSWKAGRGTPQAGGSAWGARRLAARQPAGPDAAASPEERCDGLLGLRGGRVRLLLGDGGGRRRRRCRSLGRAQAAAAKQGAVGAIGRLLGLLTALLLQQREQCGALLGSSATDAASQCLTGRLVRRLVQAQSAQLGQEVCLGRAHGWWGRSALAASASWPDPPGVPASTVIVPRKRAGGRKCREPARLHGVPSWPKVEGLCNLAAYQPIWTSQQSFDMSLARL